MFNYVALFTVSVVGIVFLDDDPTSVSPQEWLLFAVMVYAAVQFFRLYRKAVSAQKR
jgi:hypothetical protein